MTLRLQKFLALAGLALLVVLIYFLAFRDGQSEGMASYGGMGGLGGSFVPGTYVASFYLHDMPVDVMVTVSETEITAIEMGEMADSQRLMFPLFEPIMARVSDDVLFYQRADIRIHNDFPVTTGILQDAVQMALAQAVSAN